MEKKFVISIVVSVSADSPDGADAAVRFLANGAANLIYAHTAGSGEARAEKLRHKSVELVETVVEERRVVR